MTLHHRVVSLCLLVAVCCGLSRVAHAAIPHLIRFQGQAVDSKGVPLEGPYTLTFRLYDAQTVGTKLWEEAQVNVPISGGHFSVLLGQVTMLNVDWSKSLWLSVQVGTDSELAPRQQITSVPLAIRAEVAEGLVTQITTSTITDDANRLVPSGAIILWDGASCPAGYVRVSALDGKFLVSGTTYNPVAGGSNTHMHASGTYTGPSHTHDIYYTGSTRGWNASRGTSNVDDDAVPRIGLKPLTTTASGAGAITGTSAPADSRPEFATVLLCRKN